MKLTAETKINDKCHLVRRLDNVFMFGDFYSGLWRTAGVEATKRKKKNASRDSIVPNILDIVALIESRCMIEAKHVLFVC